MADRRKRDSPPAIVLHSSTGNNTPPTDSPSPSEHRKTADKDMSSGKYGDTSKPKPPSKPFKLSRAFSSGSVNMPSFGKLGKGKKTGKLKNAESSAGNDAMTTIRNGIDESESSPRKPPAVTLKQQTKPPPLLPKPTAQITESSVVDHELSPLPNSNGFVPSPHSTSRKSFCPSPKSGSNHFHDENTADVVTKGSSTSENTFIQDQVTTATDSEFGDRRFAPLPKTPTTPDYEVDSNGFRPLPPIPLHSDEDSIDERDELHQPPVQKHTSMTALCEVEGCGKGDVVKHNDSKLNQNPLTVNDRDDVKTDQNVSESNEGFVTGKKSSSMTSLTNQSSSSSSSIHMPSQTGQEGDVCVTPSAPNKKVVTPTISSAVQSYTIGEIVTVYSYALPVRVRILQGYCSDTSEVNISTNDIYNIHSVQHTKMVTIRDEDGMILRISLDAHVKIGLIYDPHNNYNKSLNGYSFNTVADLTSMSVLPKLICATQAVINSDEKSSISEGEILAVKQIHRSKFKGKKGLKVFSLLTMTNKVIPDDCQGRFTTKPSLVRLDLPHLLEKVENVFPSQAVMYPTTDDAGLNADFPGTLSRVVTLTECNTKTALIVSDVSYLDKVALRKANSVPIPKESSMSFDLLLDDEISALEVSVLKWTNPEDREDHNHVYNNLISVASSAHKFSTTASSLAQTHERETDDTSCLPVSAPANGEGSHTYINLRAISAVIAEDITGEGEVEDEDEDVGYEKVGSHLIRKDNPQKVTSSNFSPPLNNHGYSAVCHKRQKKKDDREHESDKGYSCVSERKTVDGVVVLREPEAADEDRDTARGRNEENQLASIMESIEMKFKSLQARQPSQDVTKMQLALEMLTKKLDSLDSQLNSLTASPATDLVVKPVEQKKQTAEKRLIMECNREYLYNLSVEQVGQLMVVMGLGQYQQKIVEEQISGEILLECDDSVLQEEIGITSKIHRIRLMKIIHGQHSAETLLNKVT